MRFHFIELRVPWEMARDDSCAFFYRDDLIDGHVRQSIDLSAGPGNFQRVDFGALSQAKMNSRVAG